MDHPDIIEDTPRMHRILERETGTPKPVQQDDSLPPIRNPNYPGKPQGEAEGEQR